MLVSDIVNKYKLSAPRGVYVILKRRGIKKRRGRVSFGKTYKFLTREQKKNLAEDYLANDLTMMEIAKKYNLSNCSVIYPILKRMGIGSVREKRRLNAVAQGRKKGQT